MERSSGLSDTFNTSQDGRLASDIIRRGGHASAADGFSWMRQVDARRTLLGVAAIGESGFAYPGFSRRIIAGHENGAQYSEDYRKASWYTDTHTE